MRKRRLSGLPLQRRQRPRRPDKRLLRIGQILLRDPESTAPLSNSSTHAIGLVGTRSKDCRSGPCPRMVPDSIAGKARSHTHQTVQVCEGDCTHGVGRQSFRVLGNCSCVALILSIPGHMLTLLTYIHVGNPLPTFHVDITQKGDLPLSPAKDCRPTRGVSPSI